MSSYAWKSNLRGRDIILDGACWRVGDGRAIKIWQHRWLPIKHAPKIISPILESMEEATVDCLINPETRTNHEMIDAIFIPQEAEIIKKIPLSKNDVANSIFWLLAQNGQYSCKAAYGFLKEEDASPIRDEPPVYEEGLWKEIWSLNSPNKVKHFIWRACENSLPTKCNLVHRKVIYDHTCDCCLVSLESPIHADWSCPELDCVWGASVT